MGRDWEAFKTEMQTDEGRQHFLKQAAYHLSDLRDMAGIEAKTIADFWKCSKSKVSRIESGNSPITLESLLIYQVFLRMSFDQMLDCASRLPLEQQLKIADMPPTYRDVAVAAINAIWDTYHTRKNKKHTEKETEKETDFGSMSMSFAGPFSRKMKSISLEEFRRNPEKYMEEKRYAGDNFDNSNRRFLFLDKEEIRHEPDRRIRETALKLFELYEESMP